MLWKFDRMGQRRAVVDERGAALSYRELAQEGRALCEAAGGRCLVFCLCRNTLGSLMGYTGFLNGGVVPAMLSAEMDRAMLLELCQTFRPTHLWAPDDFAYEKSACVYRRFGYRLLRVPTAQGAPLHPDLALLLTTSGSTGTPKLVRQSYRNIRANTDSIVSYLGITAEERPITTLPMQYTYGLSILNTHLDVGATILLTDSAIAQRDFWSFFREQGATSFGGVPYTYEMLHRMRFESMELPTLKTLTQAGGGLSPELHRSIAEWCAQTGRRLIVMYGQAEATARMSYLPWEKCLEKIGSIGVAIPGGAFELIDADGSVITRPGVPGELRYSGPNVTMGYALSADDLRLGDERGGTLDTGDIAQRDEEGYYTIVGRKKRFLKMYGNRFNLDEAERLLRAAFPDADCACAGTDDHLWIFSDREALLPDMRLFLSAKTGLNQAGFHTCAVDAIPRNDAGKTLYAELNALIGDGLGGAV